MDSFELATFFAQERIVKFIDREYLNNVCFSIESPSHPYQSDDDCVNNILLKLTCEIDEFNSFLNFPKPYLELKYYFINKFSFHFNDSLLSLLLDKLLNHVNNTNILLYSTINCNFFTTLSCGCNSTANKPCSKIFCLIKYCKLYYCKVTILDDFEISEPVAASQSIASDLSFLLYGVILFLYFFNIKRIKVVILII